jgi:hypothetical protein
MGIGDFMKKILISILVVGSFSTFAQDITQMSNNLGA